MIWLLVFCPTVYASEFFHQASENKIEYTVDAMAQYSLERYGSGSKSEGYDAIISFQMEKAIYKNWAVGGKLGFGFGEITSNGIDEESDGIEDIELYAKAWLPLWDGRFYYGFGTKLALEDKEVDSDNFRNRASGGIWGRIHFGYEHIAKPHILGFGVSQEFSLEDRIEVGSSGAETEVTGGEDMVVSFFIEKPNGGEVAFWGGEFSYTLTSNITRNGSELEVLSPVMRFKVYRPSPIGSSVFIPYFSAGLSPTDDVNGADLDEYTEVRIGLSYRF